MGRGVGRRKWTRDRPSAGREVVGVLLFIRVLLIDLADEIDELRSTIAPAGAGHEVTTRPRSSVFLFEFRPRPYAAASHPYRARIVGTR